MVVGDMVVGTWWWRHGGGGHGGGGMVVGDMVGGGQGGGDMVGEVHIGRHHSVFMFDSCSCTTGTSWSTGNTAWCNPVYPFSDHCIISGTGDGG